MVNGLSINEHEFVQLPTKEQLTILYHNTEILKSMVGKYKFNQKIQYIWLTLLTIGLGLKTYLGGII